MKIALFLLAFVAVSVSGRPTEGNTDHAEHPCNFDCPTIYKPVCAGDSSGDCFKMKTFSNGCYMRLYNCRNKSDFKILYEGECKPVCDK